MRGNGMLVGFVVVLAALVAGCTQEVPEPATPASVASSPEPYDGPLLDPAPDPADDGRPASPPPGSGAAGRAVDCDSGIARGGSTIEAWSEGDGGASPEEGLAAYFEIEQPFHLPRSNYRMERLAGDRALFSYDVDGETKIAVVVAKDQSRRPGWGPAAVAACDISELPARVTDRMSIEIWTGRDGNRVHTSRIHSSVGPAHCSWESAHFVSTDAAGTRATFVRDPEGVLPGRALRGEYDPDAAMPSDARDTGYRLGDWELWVVPRAAMIFMRTPSGVAAWPALEPSMGCV